MGPPNTMQLPPSSNADREDDRGDRSVTSYPDADPILVFTLDALGVETVLRAVRLLRERPECWREPHMADDANRLDRIGSVCQRALRIYTDWVKEHERAAEVRRLEEDARREHQRAD
jgi:hypothetical protein